MAEKRLGDVEPEKRFWCHDGRVLKNLQELEMALREMSGETFRHHSSADRNDFANWVKDVIGDEELSRVLRKSVTQLQTAKRVADRITKLKGKIGR